MEEKRKTKIRKEIARNVQTKQFESLRVSIEVEEEIEWSTLAEKEAKHQKVTEIAIKDFQQTFDAVMDELKLTYKPAILATQEKPTTPEEVAQAEAPKVADKKDTSNFDELG